MSPECVWEVLAQNTTQTFLYSMLKLLRVSKNTLLCLSHVNANELLPLSHNKVRP